jgi:hypothetical protein
MKTGEKTNLITQEDIDQGSKVLPLSRIDGQTVNVTLKLPNWRQRRVIVGAFLKSQDPYDMVKGVCPDVEDLDGLLNSLAPMAVSELENHAIAIITGEDMLKKTLAQVVAQIEKTTSLSVPAQN